MMKEKEEVQLLAYQIRKSQDRVVIKESSGGVYYPKTLERMFNILLEPQAASDWPPQYDRCIRVTWDLDEAVGPFMHLLGRVKSRQLHETHKAYYPPFSLFYIEGRVFSVTHIPSKDKVELYSLNQYYPDIEEPDDVQEVHILARQLIHTVNRMGMFPTKLTSPVNIYQDCVMAYLALPTLEDIPREVAGYAAECMGRSWVEAHILGCWEIPVFDYDLRSAYANVAKDLPDIRYCRWLESKEYQPEALLGFVKAKVTIHNWVYVHPILYTTEDGSLESRVGIWERYCTKAELDFIKEWGIGDWEILSGYWVFPPKRLKGELPKPLKEPIEKLLAFKEMTGLQSALAKRMSMFWGKLAETRQDGLGPYFNPVWAATITTEVNLKVARWLYENKIGPGNDAKYQYLIHVSVDGVLLTIDLPARGQWRQSYVGPALSVSSGLLYYANKKPKGLRLEDIMAMFNEHPNKGYYERQLKRRVTLADALSNGKFEDLGREKVMVSSIDFYRQGYDRDFPKVPKTGGALLKNKYRSKPRRV